MLGFSHKLRVVYLPFLLIAVGCLVGYSFLNWLLLIKAELFALDEEVVNFWAPFILPWIPILLWLNPRLKALRLSGGNGRLPDLYRFIAAFAIAAPMVVCQLYLQTAAGDLTNLAEVHEIDKAPKTKYYTIRDIFFDRANASSGTSISYAGKHNEYLVMYVFLACPLDDLRGTRTQTSHFFLGTTYRNQTSSHITESQREEEFRTFVRSSIDDYNRLDLRKFTYLERVGVSDEGRGLGAAAQRNSRIVPDAPVTILKAHQDVFEDRNGNKLAWVFGSFAIGSVVWLLMVAAAPIDQTVMNRLLRGERPDDKPAFPAYKFLIPNRSLFVTPLLFDLNVLVFVGMVFAGLGFMSFGTRDLLALGANFAPAVSDGQIWRLVTSMFIHGGMIHLVGNLFALFLAGALLEPVFGPSRFAACYIVSGIGGGIASINWHPATVSVGASGAIFGLLGAIIGFSIMNKSKASFAKKHVLGLVLYLLGYNLLLGILSAATDNADHLGGLVCGILFGLFFNFYPNFLPKKRPEPHGIV
jgi:membrane associated rhomboid family serine protease